VTVAEILTHVKASAHVKAVIDLSPEQYFQATVYRREDEPVEVRRIEVHRTLRAVRDAWDVSDVADDHEPEHQDFYLWTVNDLGTLSQVSHLAFSDETVKQVNAMIEKYLLPTAFTFHVLPWQVDKISEEC
jgi:hypothetical protein